MGPCFLIGTYLGIRAVSEDNYLFLHLGEPRAEQQFEVKAGGGADHLDCDEDILQLQLPLPARGPDGFSRGSRYFLQGQAQVAPKGEEPHAQKGW